MSSEYESPGLQSYESTPAGLEQVWTEVTEYQPSPELLQEINRLETLVAQNPVFRCPNPEDLAQNPHALQKVSQRADVILPQNIPATELIQEGTRLLFAPEKRPAGPAAEVAQKLVDAYYDYDIDFNQLLADMEAAVAGTKAREFQLQTLRAIFEQTVTVFQPALERKDQEQLLEAMLTSIRFDPRYRFPYGGIAQPLGGTYANGEVAKAVFGTNNYSTINFPSTLFLKRETADQLQEDYITAFHESVHLLKALGLEIDDSVAPTTLGLLAADSTGFRSMRLIHESNRLEKILQGMQGQGVTESAEIKKRLARLDPGEKYLLGVYYYQQLKDASSQLQQETLRRLAGEKKD